MQFSRSLFLFVIAMLAFLACASAFDNVPTREGAVQNPNLFSLGGGGDAELDPILEALYGIQAILVSAANDRAVSLASAKEQILEIINQLPENTLGEQQRQTTEEVLQQDEMTSETLPPTTEFEKPPLIQDLQPTQPTQHMPPKFETHQDMQLPWYRRIPSAWKQGLTMHRDEARNVEQHRTDKPHHHHPHRHHPHRRHPKDPKDNAKKHPKDPKDSKDSKDSKDPKDHHAKKHPKKHHHPKEREDENEEPQEEEHTTSIRGHKQKRAQPDSNIE